MKMTRTISLTAAAVTLGAAWLAPLADAQNALGRRDQMDARPRVGSGGNPRTNPAGNALGDGRALDGNLRVGSGGYNPAARDFAAEVRFRNALVTGNVPSGFSFRGSVGYTAADDFRGALGSNDIFAFERDSLGSTLVGPGFRGTDALKLQMSLQMGGAGQAAPVIVRRAGAGASAARGGRMTSPALDPDFGMATGEVDPFALPSGLLRSTSDYISTNALSLRVLGEARPPQEEREQQAPQQPALPLPGIDQEGDVGGLPAGPEQIEQRAAAMPAERMYAVASPLLGVAMKETPQYLRPTASTRLEPGRVDGRVESTLDTEATTRIDSRVTYDSFLESLRTQADLGVGEGEEAEEAPAAPRDPVEMLDAELPEGDPLEGAETTDPSDEFADRLDRLARSLSPERRRGADDEVEDEAPLRGEALREEARALLGADEIAEIETLAPPTPAAERNLYVEHMTIAEEALREGRYFDAEERFASAMRIRDNDPMAAAGRVNAQLGAGMFLSAAVNLSQLFRAYPELIPVRFDGEIMPDRDRLEIIRSELRRNFGRDTELARQSALLYAYASHQLGDREGVLEAFDEIARITAARDEELDPLYDALRVVWLKSPK